MTTQETTPAIPPVAEPPHFVPAGGLLHPIALIAIAVMALNDQVLKDIWGNAWTGKLSDLAGMIFFPLLLQAVVEVLQHGSRRPWAPSRLVLVWTCALTATVFGLVQLWAPAAELWSQLLGTLQWPFRAGMAWLDSDRIPPIQPVDTVADPTDLIAVPLVGLAARLGWHRHPTAAPDPVAG